MTISKIKSTQELERVYQFVIRGLKRGSNHPRSLDFYQEQFLRHPELLRRATEGGKLIGAILGLIEGDHVLIGELFVSPLFRRKGVGSLLLQELEKGTRLINVKKILLGALPEAEEFYLKHGYSAKLFLQIEGMQSKDKLDKFLGSLSGLNVTWKDSGADFAKAIVATEGIDKNLQSRAEKAGFHTQYLFVKQL